MMATVRPAIRSLRKLSLQRYAGSQVTMGTRERR